MEILGDQGGPVELLQKMMSIVTKVISMAMAFMITALNTPALRRERDDRGKRQMHGHQGKPPVEVDYESILQSFLELFKLTEVESSKKTDGDKDLVGRILLAYDLLRRKMSQIQEMSDPFPEC
ncbi:unnamed protein product [Cuscuta campestris]|uniref:Uncharacterized protein n=1 Tax=Cuscuta campestris TaxID=132261 RepID=A0A484LCI2_9ASTE|nr:unnamed protein product [Cuscuta campestris]